MDAFGTVVSLVSTLLSIGETFNVSGSDKMNATSSGLRATSAGLVGQEAKSRRVCKAHDHNLGWHPSVQLGPRVGRSCWSK